MFSWKRSNIVFSSSGTLYVMLNGQTCEFAVTLQKETSFADRKLETFKKWATLEGKNLLPVGATSFLEE